MQNHKFISLFTGAGGLDAGLEMAGWTSCFASDVDPLTVETLKANKGRSLGSSKFLSEAVVEVADIRSQSGEDILNKLGLLPGDVPLLVGGPPCQSWSSAGRQGGFSDPRGQLFSDFVRLAVELDVRWLMFENVRGLLTARGYDGRPGTALEHIRRELLAAGFQTSVTLVNCADYGIGQRRVRLIVFGYRDEGSLVLPEASHSKDSNEPDRQWVSLGSVLEGIDAPDVDEVIRPSEKLLQQFSQIPDGSGVKSPGKKETTRPGGHWGYKQGAFIADQAKPARTVTANSQQDWIRDQLLGLRRLSPRECAAIQSFPSDWLFCGKRTDQYRQIGNAVPPKLGEVLGKSLIRRIEKSSSPAIDHCELDPLPEMLRSAIRYTEKDHARNGASRQDIRRSKSKKVA